MGTEEEVGEQTNLAIFPNPVSDFLNFQLRGDLPNLKDGEFRILDIGGRVMRKMEGAYPGDTYILSISGWPSGAYSLQYLLDGQVITSEKFIRN